MKRIEIEKRFKQALNVYKRIKTGQTLNGYRISHIDAPDRSKWKKGYLPEIGFYGSAYNSTGKSLHSFDLCSLEETSPGVWVSK